MALAAIASGCDSLMVEVHPNPQKALSDGTQSLDFAGFQDFMTEMTSLAKFFGRWGEQKYAKGEESQSQVSLQRWKVGVL